MPHERVRYVLKSFLKKTKLWPVVGLLGARQTGKSTFLREQLIGKVKAKYLLLDRKSIRVQATNAPEHFVKSHSRNQKIPIILDEVQKAPEAGLYVLAPVREQIKDKIGICYLPWTGMV